jgi:hypothetical protein
MSTYTYSPLTTSSDPDDIHIRLLSLPPGPRTGPITCSIFETRLADAPEYEVLSYRWGSPLDQASIYVTSPSTPTSPSPLVLDDQCIIIPASLISFLYRTRAVGRTRTVWIDSICIDQSNDVEKSIQVARMRDIYQRASGTLIWLGPAGECDEALPFAWKLCKAAAPTSNPEACISNFQEKAGSHETHVGDPRLEALLSLVSRPYFERCWIVQEVVVSRNPWVVCGDLAIYWLAFVIAYISLLSTTNSWLWGYYDDRGLSLLIMLQASQKEWEEGNDVEWWRILMRHRQSRASDPRDKIFAFWGMRCKSSLEELGIVPDYTLTVEELYIKVAVEALKKGDTQILSVPRVVIRAHPGPAKESEWDTLDEVFEPLAIPSWAPDWRYTNQTPLSMTQMEIMAQSSYTASFNASQSSSFMASFNTISDPKRYKLYTRLRLEGYIVATISQLTPRPWKVVKPVGIQTILSHARTLRYVQQQISEWEAVVFPSSLQANSVYTPTGGTRMDAFYETIKTGNPDQDPEGQTAFERRQWWFRWLFTLGLGNQLWIFAIAVLVDRVLRWCGRQPHEFRFRLLLTNMANRKGARLVGETAGVEWKGSGQMCLGVVPPMCEVGDVVVLCKGVKLPLVLRRRVGGEKGEKEREEWEFIGDCYVYGVMKGEAWNESNCQDLWLV